MAKLSRECIRKLKNFEPKNWDEPRVIEVVAGDEVKTTHTIVTDYYNEKKDRMCIRAVWVDDMGMPHIEDYEVSIKRDFANVELLQYHEAHFRIGIGGALDGEYVAEHDASTYSRYVKEKTSLERAVKALEETIDFYDTHRKSDSIER